MRTIRYRTENRGYFSMDLLKHISEQVLYEYEHE